MSDFSFTAEDVQDDLQSDFYEEPVPAGDYKVQIKDTRYAANKAGTGHWLMVSFEIISNGKQKGKDVANFFNVDHPNATAMEISKRDLSRMMNAINMKEFTDYEQLLGHKLQIKIDVKNERNEVKNYYAFPNDEPLVTADELATDDMEEPPF
jgi:hypothetical protein|tara:strand:- start:778 stop:1233 length:456 start_codon:yes stop_codon:yes gene_type:complete